MVMQMNAMESLLDPGMFYLDVLSGISGVVLASMLYACDLPQIGMHAGVVSMLVILSRGLVDAGYHYLVSPTDMFGGSVEQMIYSSLLWVVLFIGLEVLMNKETVPLEIAKKVGIAYGSTLLFMMAIARITGWG